MTATAITLLDTSAAVAFIVSEHAAHASTWAALAEAGISGGAVYDALVAAAAVHHGLPLVSRDRRALDTYRALGLDVEFLS